MPWFETRELLDIIRRLCRVEALSLETHDRGLVIAQGDIGL